MHTSPTQAAGTGDAGGMNVAVLATARELAARGIAVDLITRATGTPSVAQLGPGVTLHELAAGPASVLPKARLPEVSDEFGEAVAALARRTRYDLVHAHYWLSGIATLPVALELGLPFAQSFHTLAAMKNARRAPGQESEPERRLQSERYLAAQAGAVIAGSSAEAASLIDDVRAPAERVWVIPPGVDVDLFRPHRGAAEAWVRAELGAPAGRPILAVVGRVQPLKNQELAVRAIAELRAQAGWTPLLVVVGEATPGDGGYADSLRSLAAGLDVADAVRFVGALPREGVADLLAVASLTLVPSYSETFGLVALESAASGTPVLGNRGTGLVESVAEGVSGRLLDSLEPRHWAEEIADLLGDTLTLARLSASARDHALGLTWAASATALLAVYGSLLA